MAKLSNYNLAICLLVATGGFSYGFGAGSFPASTGQPGFYIYYDLDPSSLCRFIHVAWNPRYYLRLRADSVGNRHRSYPQRHQCSLFLRRCSRSNRSMLRSRLAGTQESPSIAGVLALIGGALVAGSVIIPMLIVVRILQGGGVGMLLALVPLYLTEVSPPQRRGFLTGLSTLSFGLGYVVYVLTTVQSQDLADEI